MISGLLVTRARATETTHKHALHLIRLLFDLQSLSPSRPPLYTLLPYTYTHINKHAHTHHSIPSTHQSSSTARILTAATSASRLHHCFTFTLPSLILSELGASEHVSGDQPANTGQLVCRMKYHSFFSEERKRGGIWSREKDYRNVKIDRKGVFKYILAF